MNLGEIAWQFNETVSLLREARTHLPGECNELNEEIDKGLPAIQDALEALVVMPSIVLGDGVCAHCGDPLPAYHFALVVEGEVTVRACAICVRKIARASGEE